MPRLITGAAAVIEVLQGLGLLAPTSVAGSQDPTVKQMWQLASDSGQWLCSEHEWQVLNREHVISTSPGVSTYALPTDWNGYVTDAQWNRTSRLPALGSLSEQEWQMLKARNIAGSTFTLMFKISQDVVEFYSVPTTVQTIVLPYKSRGWVRKINNTRVDVLSADDDVVLFDSLLFKLKLKLAWLAEKKFDTTRAQIEFDDYLTTCKERDSPARTLSLGASGEYPYLGYVNIPDTRYGS